MNMEPKWRHITYEVNSIQMLAALRGTIKTVAQGDLETVLWTETKSSVTVQSRDYRWAIVLMKTQEISSQSLFYLLALSILKKKYVKEYACQIVFICKGYRYLVSIARFSLHDFSQTFPELFL